MFLMVFQGFQGIGEVKVAGISEVWRFGGVWELF